MTLLHRRLLLAYFINFILIAGLVGTSQVVYSLLRNSVSAISSIANQRDTYFKEIKMNEQIFFPSYIRNFLDRKWQLKKISSLGVYGHFWYLIVVPTSPILISFVLCS